MAVTSRTCTLKFSHGTLGDTGGFRQWQAVAAVQDTAAGSSVVITTTVNTGGATPPNVADTLTLNVYASNGTTLVRAFTLTPGAASQTSTFHFTDTGASGGSNRSGTYIFDLRATKTTGGPTNTYDYETDGSPSTAQSTYSATIVDRGYIRGTTTCSQVLSDVSLGGGKSAVIKAGASLFVRSTLAAPLNVARACTNLIRDFTVGTVRRSNTPAAATTTFDSTFSGTSTTTGRVNIGFPAAQATYETHFTVPNNALTGIAETVVDVTADTATIDPRHACVHLMQIGVNSYATPPMSEPNLASQRVFPSVGYLGTAIRTNAQGSFTPPNVVGGVNGLTFTVEFLSPVGGDFGGTGYTTATRGGEDGWQNNLLAWTEAAAGLWTKTVRITAPADFVGDAYLVDNNITYLLIAVNPDLRVRVAIGTNNPSAHMVPGSTLQVDVSLLNKADRAHIEPDSVYVIFRRTSSGDRSQFLNSAGTWVDAFDGTVPPVAVPAESHTPSQLSADQWVYRLELVTDDTWTNDFEVLAVCEKDGVLYDRSGEREVVGSANSHDGYGVDTLGFALHNVITQR